MRFAGTSAGIFCERKSRGKLKGTGEARKVKGQSQMGPDSQGRSNLVCQSPASCVVTRPALYVLLVCRNEECGSLASNLNED
jgi:hypothetical protein